MKSEFDKLFEEMGTWQQDQLEKERTWNALQVLTKRDKNMRKIIYPLTSVMATALIFVVLTFLLTPNAPSMQSEGTLALQKDVTVEKIYAKANEKLDTFKAYSTLQTLGTGSTTDGELLKSATELIHTKDNLKSSGQTQIGWIFDAVFVLSDGTEQQWKFGFKDTDTIAMDMQTGSYYIDQGNSVLYDLSFLPTDDQTDWRNIVRLIGMCLLLGNAWLARIICRYSKEELEGIDEKKEEAKVPLLRRLMGVTIIISILPILFWVDYVYNGVPRIIFVPLLFFYFVILSLTNVYFTKVEGDIRNEKKKKADRYATVFLLMGVILVALGL